MSPPDAPFDVTTHNVKDRELTVAWEVPHRSDHALPVLGYRVVMQVVTHFQRYFAPFQR
jgi:hypothetical protein